MSLHTIKVAAQLPALSWCSFANNSEMLKNKAVDSMAAQIFAHRGLHRGRSHHFLRVQTAFGVGSGCAKLSPSLATPIWKN